MTVLRHGRPNAALAKAILRRIERRGADPKLRGKSAEDLDRMVKATRQAIWTEKVAGRS